MSELLVSTSGFDGRAVDRSSTDSEVSPNCRRSSEYPSIMTKPGSSDACATIVQGLMQFNQSNDEEFSRKACESLVKKMKDKRDELDALIIAVYSRGEDAKKCITISRTLDGRLQVAGRKGFPHVVYAKIFRWPDLHKNELKHLPLCENAFDLKADNVCVNPYHYERVLNSGIGAMDMKADDDEIMIEETCSRGYMGMMSKPMGPPSSMPPPRTTQMPQKPMMSPNAAHFSGNRFLNFNNQIVHPHPMMQMVHPTTMPHNPYMSPQPSMMPPPTMSMASSHSSHVQQPAFAVPKPRPTTAPTMPVLDLIIDPNEQSTTYQTIENLKFAKKNYVCVTSTEPPDGHNPENMVGENGWGSMVYHERTQTICMFRAKISTIFIDCGFATGGNRWCLGNETNSFRDEETLSVRNNIGKGVRLSCKANGDVWIQVYSHTPVFLQSHYLDRESGRSTGDVIHKLYPGARIKLFDLDKCKKTMREQWLSNLMSKCRMASTRVEDDDNLGDGPSERMLARNDADDPLQELFRYCVARMSFVKGWGPDYPGRASIAECPCWVEIKMNQAFQFLDHLLTEVQEHENVNPIQGSSHMITPTPMM